MGTVLPCLRWVAIDESIGLLDLLFKSVAKLNILNMLPVEWSDHVYFVHPSTDVWVDITADIGRDIDRYSTDMSVDISTDTRPMFRPRYVGRCVGRLSADISVDIAPDTRPIR